MMMLNFLIKLRDRERRQRRQQEEEEEKNNNTKIKKKKKFEKVVAVGRFNAII